jgi:hypothetical protein
MVDNLRSNLLKNGLIFTEELLNVHRNMEIGTFIKQVLPAVLLKTIYEKNFIVIEAKKILDNAVQNCLFDETI